MLKKVLRSLQTHFPYLHNARFRLKFLFAKISRKPHEKDFEALKLFSPIDGQEFVDIGSNRGEAILSMLLTCKAQPKIIGFEPNILIYNNTANYFSSNTQVKIYNYGLGDKEGICDLYVPFYRKWMFDGLSSFKYEAAYEWLKTRMWLFDEKNLTIKKVSCQIKKLDDFELRPYFIKIDVQGFEFEVLKGGEKTIKLFRPILLIETINNQAMEFLREIDYQFYKYSKNKFVAGEGELNTFCIPIEKINDLNPSLV